MVAVPPPASNQPMVPAIPALPQIRNEDIKTDLQDPNKHHVTVTYNNKSYKVTVFGGQNPDQIKNFALELIALAVAYNVGGKNKKLTVSKGHDQQGQEQVTVDRNRNAGDGTPKLPDSGTTIRDIIHVKKTRVEAKLPGATDPTRRDKLNEKLTAHIAKGLEIFDAIYPLPSTRVRATPIADNEEEEDALGQDVEGSLVPDQEGSTTPSSSSSETPSLENRDDLRREFEAEIHPQ